MSALLNLLSLTLAHGDAKANENPSLRYFHWKRDLMGIPVTNPKTEGLTLDPGQEKLVFSGVRATSLDATTQFTVSLSPLDPSRYRFTFSAGTDPVLRTDRGLALSGVALTLTANANGTLTMAAGAGTPFAAVVAGDTVFVPGVSTGDASIGFNSINEGSWKVLSASGASLTLSRPSSEFGAVSEAVTPSTNGVLAFSVAGVQAGDKADLSAGFDFMGTFPVLAVTSKWFEVTSTSPLVAATGTPGVAGLAFYTSAKRFLRIEADQDCVVRVNGDTSNSNRLSPWHAGETGQVAEFVKVGPTWSLSIVNRSTSPLNLTVISAE